MQMCFVIVHLANFLIDSSLCMYIYMYIHMQVLVIIFSNLLICHLVAASVAAKEKREKEDKSGKTSLPPRPPTRRGRQNIGNSSTQVQLPSFSVCHRTMPSKLLINFSFITYRETTVITSIYLKSADIIHVLIHVYVNSINSTSIIILLTDTPLPGDLTLSQLLQILNQRGLQHGLNVLEFSVKQESDKKDNSQSDQSKCITH